MRRAHRQRGAVTVEAALVLPLLLALVAALVWLLAVGAAQVRCIDAAREAARAAARGDSDADAVRAAEHVAPDGSQITLVHADGQVTATVSGVVEPPGGVVGDLLPSAQVRASAVALAEGATP